MRHESRECAMKKQIWVFLIFIVVIAVVQSAKLIPYRFHNSQNRYVTTAKFVPRHQSSASLPTSFEGEILLNSSANYVKTKLCDTRPKICAHGKSIKLHLATRRKFSKQLKRNSLSIYIDNSATGWFGIANWLSENAFQKCNNKCTLSKDSGNSDIFLSHLHLPSERKSDQLYAVLNVEAHSHDLPTNIDNLILMSYHAESDLVVNYAYIVMHSFFW